MNSLIKASFFRKILLPAVLSILLFVISVFAFIIPSFEKNAIAQKQIMLNELTNTAWSILNKYNSDSGTGSVSVKEAQARAIAEIEALRYGPDKKDYFWITDLTPRMVMHPYVHELTGKSLQEFADPDGKKLFIEAVKIAREKGEGFISYKWQLKDDSLHIVPKISFVKKFAPWNWVIGTGIYLDDVQAEIASLTNKLVLILITISLIIALLIAFITYQSLRIENKRQAAELQLNESKERYRALVEASSEGALMVFEDYMYANKTMLSMLGYVEHEIASLKIHDIVSDEELQKKYPDFQAMLNHFELPDNYETLLKQKDGRLIQAIIALSQISIAGKKAIIVIAKDISIQKIAEAEKQEIDFNASLADNFSIGFFKTSFSRKSRFLEASPAAVKILGFSSGEELCKTQIEDLFAGSRERIEFARELLLCSYIRKKIIKIRKNKTGDAFITVSLMVKEDKDGEKYCEGIVEDITDEHSAKISTELLMQSILAESAYLALPLKSFIKSLPGCDMYTPVVKAAGLMKQNNSGYILVKTPEGKILGLVTDKDIRNRLIAENHPPESPVYEIMSAPLHTISDAKSVSDALLMMRHQNVDDLVIVDSLGKPSSVFSGNDVVRILENSHQWIIHQIKNAACLNEIITAQKLVNQMTVSLTNTGIDPEHMTRFISSVADAVINRLFFIVEEELGEAPVKFAFISFGSVGRDEQTLATDQDNALVYEDTDRHSENETSAYFLKLGRKICDLLEQTGYSYCKGGFMAKNQVWCKPLSVWKNYFNEWVHTLIPQNLLDVSVLFDFRFSYGEREIADELREYVRSITQNNDPFYYHLAENTISLKLPPVMTGNLPGEAIKKHLQSFDIKKTILPVVSFARIYALKNGIGETNTLERLDCLHQMDLLSGSDYQNIKQLYRYLMRLRIEHQVVQIRQGKTPDNYLQPESLSELDQIMIKKILSLINSMFTRLSYDFKRTIG